MPTVQGTDAFDHGFDVPADYDAVFGTPTAVSSPLYQGRLNTLEISSPGNEGVRKNYTGSPTLGWTAVALRVDALPVGGGLLFFEIHTAGGERGQIRLTSAGNIFAGLGADFGTPTALTTGTYHWVEAIFDVSGTTHTLYWRFDGVDQDTVSSTPGSGSTCDYTQVLSESTDGTLTWYAGGYWSWGLAASTSDWLGEPTTPGASSTLRIVQSSLRW